MGDFSLPGNMFHVADSMLRLFENKQNEEIMLELQITLRTDLYNTKEAENSVTKQEGHAG
jgi:hypothetical protein